MNTRNRNRVSSIDFTILVTFLFLNVISVANAQSNSVLTSRIQEYTTLYPDIYFLHLQSSEKNTDISMSYKQFGEDAVNLDYEHDPVMRNDLLKLQFMRINYLLKNRIPSATLFKTGKHAAYIQPYVCVITLDESSFLSQPVSSVQLLLGDDMRDSSQGKSLIALDRNTFLQYTLDHEIYHCLDAYLHGHSISKSTDEITVAYEHFLSEYRADLYASLIVRQSYSSAIEFLDLLASYRIMGLVDFDTEHYTVAAIRQVIHMPKAGVSNTSIVDIAQGIRELSRNSEPAISEYAQLINVASGLALYLGIEDGGLNDRNDPARDLATSPQLSLTIQEFEGTRSYITSKLYLEDE